MEGPVVAGLMAYGMSGRVFHAPFLHAHPGFRLKAVTERHAKKAQDDYPEVTSYPTVGELLKDPEIDLVIVNTPNFTHVDLAREALMAGKHVLVEKPVATTSAEHSALQAVAKKSGRKLMVYQNRRWDSDFISVKQVIESGRLGRLIEVHFRFDRYKPALSQKFFKEDSRLAASGLEYDLGPHLLDQAISLFGRPLSFRKVRGSFRENSEVTDYFHYHLCYSHQLQVYLTSSLLVAQPMPAFILHGTLGSFVKNRADIQEAQLEKGTRPADPGYGRERPEDEGILVTFDENQKKVTRRVAAETGNYGHLFDAVYRTIRDNALFPITAEQVAWQIELLEAP